MFDQNKLDY